MIRNMLAVLGILLFSSYASAEIAWQTNLQAAHAQAKAQGRLLLIHFYTEPCVWCERLEQGSFQSPEVVSAINENFVPVKIHGGNNPELAQYFKVRGYPMDVVVDADGNIYGHGISPQQPAQYVSMLLASIGEHARNLPAGQKIASGPAGQQSAAQVPAAQVATQPMTAGPATAGYGVPDYAQHPPAAGLQQPAVAITPPQTAPTTAAPTAAPYALPPGMNGNSGAGQVAGYPKPSAASGPVATPVVAKRPSGPGGAPSIPPAIEPASEELTQHGRAEEANANAEVATANAAEQEKYPLGLDGCCPVAVVREDRWVPGDQEYGAYHMGRLYLFASAEAQAAFMADPNRYSPMLAGNDVVALLQRGQVKEGSREWGLTHKNRMYLFSSEESLNEFYANPEQYSGRAEQIMRQVMQSGEGLTR